MKLRIIASALLIMLLTVGISNQVSARPGYWRGGFYGPRTGLRVVAPIPAPVVVGGYYGGGYAPAYGPSVVVGGGYYGGGYYNRGYYNHGYYRGGGYRGSYGPRGGYRR